MKYALTLLLLVSSIVQAAIISPVELSITAVRPVTSFLVTNDGTETVTYQAQGRTWVQVDGENVETPSSEIIITPPIVTIPAGGKQIFRVGLSKKDNLTNELSYKVYLEDVSDIVKNNPKNVPSISFKFSHNLPLFINSNIYTSKPSLLKCPTKNNCIRLINNGSKHFKLSAVSTTGNDFNEVMLDIGPKSRVLANSWIEYKFKSIAGIKSFNFMTSDGLISIAADEVK